MCLCTPRTAAAGVYRPGQLGRFNAPRRIGVIFVFIRSLYSPERQAIRKPCACSVVAGASAIESNCFLPVLFTFLLLLVWLDLTWLGCCATRLMLSSLACFFQSLCTLWADMLLLHTLVCQVLLVVNLRQTLPCAALFGLVNLCYFALQSPFLPSLFLQSPIIAFLALWWIEQSRFC